MLAYKLLRKRKDGSLGSLFINRKAHVPIGTWMPSEEHPTKGYAYRPGWHVMPRPNAPHLTENGRVWVEVEIEDFSEFNRPESQGGTWYLANWMKVIREIT